MNYYTKINNKQIVSCCILVLAFWCQLFSQQNNHFPTHFPVHSEEDRSGDSHTGHHTHQDSLNSTHGSDHFHQDSTDYIDPNHAHHTHHSHGVDQDTCMQYEALIVDYDGHIVPNQSIDIVSIIKNKDSIIYFSDTQTLMSDSYGRVVFLLNSNIYGQNRMEEGSTIRIHTKNSTHNYDIHSIQQTCETEVPACFNYQAIARDDQDQPIVDRELDVRMTIIDNLGVEVYTEIHHAFTNSYGLMNLSRWSAGSRWSTRSSRSNRSTRPTWR